MKKILIVIALVSIIVLSGCKDKYEVCKTGFESREALIKTLIEKDTSPDNPYVNNRWDCEEGCIYAEWITYGYRNLSKSSQLYKDCSEICWMGGDSYFENKGGK